MKVSTSFDTKPFYMTLYIDIENKKLVQSITSDRSVSTPVFMQGDNEPLEIFLLGKGEDTIFSPKALTVGNDFLRVAIARFKGYPKSLTYASGYTLNPNGGAEVLLPLNTKDIEIAPKNRNIFPPFWRWNIPILAARLSPYYRLLAE